MTYKLEIRGEADEEIFEAYSWYEQQAPGLGERFIGELEAVFKKITLNPLHYKIARSVFRQSSVKSFPFVVYFELTRDRIIVYSVFHTSRKPIKDFNA
jgi:plasmid stabilization system protein ParE